MGFRNSLSFLTLYLFTPNIFLDNISRHLDLLPYAELCRRVLDTVQFRRLGLRAGDHVEPELLPATLYTGFVGQRQGVLIKGFAQIESGRLAQSIQ